jgi:hypothetical protein
MSTEELRQQVVNAFIQDLDDEFPLSLEQRFRLKRKYELSKKYDKLASKIQKQTKAKVLRSLR